MKKNAWKKKSHKKGVQKGSVFLVRGQRVRAIDVLRKHGWKHLRSSRAHIELVHFQLGYAP